MHLWQMRGLVLLCLIAFCTSCSDDESPTAPTPATTAEFVPIPAGQNPVTGDTIAAFEMSVTEVIQGEWQALMRTNPSAFRGSDLPVHNITWFEAVAYCDSLNVRNDGYRYRLPTVAEWEYACRAGTKTDFYSGNRTAYDCYSLDLALSRVGWYCGNSGLQPHTTANKEPNAWGLYDMHGNVPEWCSDAYDSIRHIAKGGGYRWNPEWETVQFSVPVLSDCGDCTFDDQPLGFRLVRTKR